MTSYIKNHQTAFGILGFVISVAVAIIYSFVVPDEANTTQGIVGFAIKYAHSACWLLLATASILFACKGPKNVIRFISFVALACYVVFMAAVLSV